MINLDAAEIAKIARRPVKGLRFVQASFGFERSPGWLVYHNGSIITSLWLNEKTGSVGNNDGFDHPFACCARSWPSLEAAKDWIGAVIKLREMGLDLAELSR
jgi:hypothetical protein